MISSAHVHYLLS